jgi:hypothetical protein
MGVFKHFSLKMPMNTALYALNFMALCYWQECSLPTVLLNRDPVRGDAYEFERKGLFPCWHTTNACNTPCG